MKILLVDNQLPVALSRFLSAEGLPSLHVLDIGLDEATDWQIWQYADTHDYAIISKDEDFFHLATANPQGSQLVWVRLGNCRKAFLLEVFRKLLPELREMLTSGQQIIEITE